MFRAGLPSVSNVVSPVPVPHSLCILAAEPRLFPRKHYQGHKEDRNHSWHKVQVLPLQSSQWPPACSSNNIFVSPTLFVLSGNSPSLWPKQHSFSGIYKLFTGKCGGVRKARKFKRAGNCGWRWALIEVLTWRDTGNQKLFLAQRKGTLRSGEKSHKDNRSLKPACSLKSCLAHSLKRWLGQAALNATIGQWHWPYPAFRTCSPPIFVTLARMCQLVAHSNVSARAVHGSPAPVTLGTVNTKVPPDLLAHSVWGWAIESAF